MPPPNAVSSADERHPDVRNRDRDHRWCEKFGYFIDLGACEARARQKLSCRRCLAKWQQLSFPFMNAK